MFNPMKLLYFKLGTCLMELFFQYAFNSEELHSCFSFSQQTYIHFEGIFFKVLWCWHCKNSILFPVQDDPSSLFSNWMNDSPSFRSKWQMLPAELLLVFAECHGVQVPVRRVVFPPSSHPLRQELPALPWTALKGCINRALILCNTIHAHFPRFSLSLTATNLGLGKWD